MNKKDTLDEEELNLPDKNKKAEETEIHEGSWIKSVIKNGKWYLMGSFMTKGLLFFLMPIYTAYLDPDEMGIFSTLYTIAQVMPIIISFGLDAAFGRFFHDYKKDPEKLKSLFSTLYWFVAFYGLLVLLLVLYSTQWWLVEATEIPSLYPYALLTFLPPILMQLGTFGIIYMRQALLSKMNSIVEMLSTVANILLTLPLLIIWDLGVIARLWGNLAASLFIFIVMTTYFVKKGILVWRFDKVILRTALVFSIPLIPSLASKWINMLSDRLILAQYADMTDVGLYSLAANIAMIILMIQTSMSTVLQPVSISGLVHDKENTKKKMSEFSLLMWIVMIVANLGAFLFAKDLVTIFAAKSYEGAFIYIPILGFTFVVGGQYRFFSYILEYHKKTGIISIATISSAIANVAMNIIFIPIYGALAAPFATVMAGVVLLLVISIAAQRIDKIELKWRELILIGVIYAIVTVFGVVYVFDAEVTILNFILKGLLFLAVSASFIYIGNYQQSMIDYVRTNLLKR
ncbi:MAG: flippase [Saprospiraceae bacterium]